MGSKSSPLLSLSSLLPGRIQTELYLSRDLEREGSRRRSGPPNSALRKRRFISESRRKCSATSPGACIRGAAGSAREARRRTASSGLPETKGCTRDSGATTASGPGARLGAAMEMEGSSAGTALAAACALRRCLSASSRALSWSSSSLSSSSSIVKAPLSFFCRLACRCSSCRRCSSRSLRSSAHLASCSAQRFFCASSSSSLRLRASSSSRSRRVRSSSSLRSRLRRSSSSVRRTGDLGRWRWRECERERRRRELADASFEFCSRALPAAARTSWLALSFGRGFSRYAGLRREVIRPGIGASAVPARWAIGPPMPVGRAPEP
mmetsp:Transcript_113493/g.301584  ORF Transcript_113493/g.301584 Transcript_113493/m.301584 type:complete len:323 (-) Transcript_113493:1-969(-)